MTLGEVLTILALVAVVAARDNDCKFRQFSDTSSFVCECSASHCDVIEEYTLDEENFVVYTSGKRGFRLDKDEMPIRNRPTPNIPDTSITIAVDRSDEYQTILGFGGSFSDAAALNLYNLSSDVQENLLRAYFSSDGIEYSFGRVPIASCDFSTREYSYAETPNDFDLEDFQLAFEDINYKIPMIKRASAMSSRPIKLLGSAWSAPGWMKTNGAMKGGGRLKGLPGGEYYKTWALYLAKFIEAYTDFDVHIWGLTTGNEPTAGLFPDWDWQCMYFNPELQRDFIKLDMGPTLHSRGHQDVNIVIMDDQRIHLPEWADVVIEDPLASQFVSGIGLHWYMDFLVDGSRLNDTHHAHPEYFMINTEACQGYLPWQEKVVLGSWERGESYSHNIIEDLSNWVSGWIDWNMALDTIGGPNWVGNFVDSPIIVNPDQDVFYKQPMYYHLGHFSKFISPGSVRVGSSVDRDRLVEHLAFKLPDGNMALVVLNRKEFSFPLHIYDSDVGCLNAEIPSRSIQTYLWKSPSSTSRK
ncbi:lysosomal acid glucosylceramidase-like isoform X3 [Lytechinus variegatus]|uniref:lysosomal acid glucosylceramidase-like isoform X2 n=1 Tax=Lytechinus variegatus TaxID=7654 RepID=UPI001BB1228E|nr:lysosomal acid glucosylceramidase-like isoform X2 [Lytechinus variegatus]XP_041465065.1 lysosomal acid glucosylceramidase-like isoform X3 [Lytechinus variegatus]